MVKRIINAICKDLASPVRSRGEVLLMGCYVLAAIQIDSFWGYLLFCVVISAIILWLESIGDALLEKIL